LLKFLNYTDDSIELYNLKDDIGEKNDLSEKMAKKAGQLKAMLEKWRKDVDAKMPTSNHELLLRRSRRKTKKPH